jgi:hypothetical protein
VDSAGIASKEKATRARPEDASVAMIAGALNGVD